MKEIIITKQEYAVLESVLVRCRDAVSLVLNEFDMYNCTYEQLDEYIKLEKEWMIICSLLAKVQKLSKGDCKNVQE